MKHYTTLLFDADGTLLDFDAAQRDALIQTFEHYGYPLTKDVRQRYDKINSVLWAAYERGEKTRDEVIFSRFGILFEQLGIQDDGVQFEIDYQSELANGHQCMDHAMDVIKSLYKDFDLYIASNGVTATQYQRLADSGLRPYFRDVFVSEEIGYQKPRLEYFTNCFKKIRESDKEHMLIIGDSLSSDIQGGNNAGIDTCWYHPNGKVTKNNYNITYEIKDLRELYKIVGKE